MGDAPKLYSAGDCPVCVDSGALLVLSAGRGPAPLEHFLYCPMCGLAFRTRPSASRLDELVSLSTLAPSGVVLASAVDAARSYGPVSEITGSSARQWLVFLEDELDKLGETLAGNPNEPG